jgi:hypothetical protein
VIAAASKNYSFDFMMGLASVLTDAGVAITDYVITRAEVPATRIIEIQDECVIKIQ